MQGTRAKVESRDGYCRLRLTDTMGPCGGESQWAHFGDYRRFKTRGQAPEDRHVTHGSLMLCDKHHDRYDGQARPRIDIEAVTVRECDGPLRFESAGAVYEEDER